MKNKKSFFYSFFKNNLFVYLNKSIYSFTESKTENYLKWFGNDFYLKKGSNIRTLEDNYLEKHKYLFKDQTNYSFSKQITENLDKINFTLEEVLNLTEREVTVKERSILEKIVSENYLVLNGDLFEIFEAKTDGPFININKKWYGIKPQSSVRLLDLEKKFKEELKREAEYDRFVKEYKYLNQIPKKVLKDISNKGFFYDELLDLGFEINRQGFFVLKLIKPYILHEKMNNKDYYFGQARVGVKIYKTHHGFDWNEPIVINPYSHPALSHKDVPFQRICNGKFNYNTLRKKYPKYVDKQIKAVLNKAKDLLEKGYFSAGGAYHKLTSPIFKEKETSKKQKARITNLK